MRLSINYLDEFEYSHTAQSLPIIACISSEETITVAAQVNLNGLYLDSLNNPELSFGYEISGRISQFKEKIVITPFKPVFKLYDLFEDEDTTGLISGPYKVTVILSVFLYENDHFRRRELTCIREMHIR